MSVQKVDTLEDFKKALAENKRVAVDFYADWCGPCRMISPKFAKFAETYKDIKFFKVSLSFHFFAVWIDVLFKIVI